MSEDKKFDAQTDESYPRLPRNDKFTDFIPEWMRQQIEDNTFPTAQFMRLVALAGSKLSDEEKLRLLRNVVGFGTRHNDVAPLVSGFMQAVQSGEIPLSMFSGRDKYEYLPIFAGAAKATEWDSFATEFTKATDKTLELPREFPPSHPEHTAIIEGLGKWREYLRTRKKVWNVA